jgi:hypothetical protein
MLVPQHLHEFEQIEVIVAIDAINSTPLSSQLGDFRWPLPFEVSVDGFEPGTLYIRL